MEKHDATGEVRTCDYLGPSLAHRVAAMLDRGTQEWTEGRALPPCWHFPLLAGDTRRSALRGDGFPGLGVPMPDLGLPRLLLVGRSLTWPGTLRLGQMVERRSALVDMHEKQGRGGRMVLVTLEHALTPAGSDTPALVETQTYALMPQAPATPLATAERPPAPDLPGARSCRFTPDETLLFQYSALGFNSHKIHLDRAHAQKVEGLPDLVVNGGLATLLACEFLCTPHDGAPGFVPRALRARHLAPLYCNRPLTLRAAPTATGARVEILNEAGALAAVLEVDA